MPSNTYKEAKLSLYILTLVLVCSIVFYCFAAMFTSMGYEGYRNALNTNTSTDYTQVIIIIDPGHGGEDPGASDNGLIEKDLNLEVATLLEEMLSSFGYKTLITREDDRLLYNSGEENRKKYYDLKNRETIAKSYDNAIFVSIHMNKFPVSYCKGLQVFYSSNNENSITLAKNIQESSRLLQTDNERVVKTGNDTIYLLKNLNIPAVLVECGFLSNPDEAALLAENNYKISLAFSIYCGIAEYLEKNNEN